MSEELLMAISQIAVALIGFSGVVTALGHEQGKRWTAAELLQLRTQVEPSLCALFGGLVPSTVALFDLEFGQAWRISNAVLATFVFIALAAFVNRTRRAPTLLSQKLLTVVSVVVLIGMVLAAFGIVANSQFTFMSGLWLGLVVGVHNFALLLFRIERGDV